MLLLPWHGVPSVLVVSDALPRPHQEQAVATRHSAAAGGVGFDVYLLRFGEKK